MIRDSRIEYIAVLKPQDVLVLLKLSVADGDSSYSAMANALGMSASEVHSAFRRASEAGLLNRATKRPNRQALLEFLVHGLRYVFPAKRGGITRGLPTAHAAPPLKDRIAGDSELVPVWPDPEGDVRGEELCPLYRSVPGAARRDPALYELLALVDAIRSGRARERTLAIEELRSRLA
jgi:DNA-binding Lrp family transcriptional regulator